VRALVYDTAAALLHRVGETSLAWTAADRRPGSRPSSPADLSWAAPRPSRLSYVIADRTPDRGAGTGRCSAVRRARAGDARPMRTALSGTAACTWSACTTGRFRLTTGR